jgi:hypothetical protein
MLLEKMQRNAAVPAGAWRVFGLRQHAAVEFEDAEFAVDQGVGAGRFMVLVIGGVLQ